jgi:glycosyltransferase involved in cell wall biosynthesis
MGELISVIIPTFNVSKFIGTAIQSVLDQTYRDFEIIVVDDCSRDDTPEIVAGFGDKVRLLRHRENRGAAEARNTGVAEAKGSIVAFLDGDDKWMPEKLEAFADSFSRHPDVLFAFSDFSRFEWEDGSFFALSNSQVYPMIYRVIERCKYRDRKQFLIPRKDAFPLLLEGYPIYPTAIVVRRRLFDRFGMWRKIRTNEDFDFGLRSCRVSDFIYIDETLAMVGRHDSNLTLDILRQMEGNISVIDLHLSATEYSKEERDLISYNKGRRLCGLGYNYHRSGNRKLAIEKYRKAMWEKGWFWHSLARVGYVAIAPGRNIRPGPSAGEHEG